MSKTLERLRTDWEFLEEALSISQGTAFYFVLCDEGALREGQMQRLRKTLESQGRSVQVVRFDPESPHLSSRLASLPSDSPLVVFVDVRGIELAHQGYAEALGQQALNARQALQSLNLQREQLGKLDIPLLFWVSAQAMGQIAQQAADLFAAKSGIFDLRAFRLAGLRSVRSKLGGAPIDIPDRETRLPVLTRAKLDLPYDELRRRFQLYDRRLREEQAKSSLHLPRQASLHQELALIAWVLREITQALEHQEAAVALYRELVEKGGEEFLAHLAAGLRNLGSMLSALSRREEALAATQEAMELYRQLAQQHPDAFLPDLVVSLTNLGASLSALGRREEALAATQEAVESYRQLAAQQPDAFLPYLASSLSVYGVILRGLGRHAEAIAAFAEGLRVILPLVQAFPTAFGERASALLQGYLSACEEAGETPDKTLVTQAHQAIR